MILRTFLFWRTGLFFVALLGSIAFSIVPNGSLGSPSAGNFDYWLSWAQWDGGHYMEIVKNGYEDVANVAFMPLFPAIARYTGVLFGPLFSGLLVANVAFLFFLYAIKKYVEQSFPKEVAKYTVITYLFFPTSIYAIAFYSEGLYLLLSCLALLFFLKQKMVFLTIFACLAAATRFVGFALVAAMAVSFLKTYFDNRSFIDIKRVVILLLGASVTLFLLGYFLLFPYGRSFGAIVSVQSLWGREVTDPASTILSYVFPILFFEQRPIMDYFDLFFTVVPLLLLTIQVKKLGMALWIYSMLAILIPASTGTLSGMPRYLLASFGFFVLLAQFLAQRPRVRIAYFIASLCLQLFFLVRFFNGFWVS